METMPLSMIKHMEEDVPPVFMILDTFDKDIKVRLFSLKYYINAEQSKFVCIFYVT